MKRGVAVEWQKYPKEHFDAIYPARVHPLVKFYGQFIDTIPIDQFAFSCYSQGLRDAVQLEIQTGKRLSEAGTKDPDYMI